MKIDFTLTYPEYVAILPGLNYMLLPDMSDGYDIALHVITMEWLCWRVQFIW